MGGVDPFMGGEISLGRFDFGLHLVNSQGVSSGGGV